MSARTIDLGQVTAYAEAVAGGYTGTKAQFEADMGNSALNATAAATAAIEAAGSASAAATALTNAQSAASTAIDAKNTAVSAKDTAVASATAAKASETNADLSAIAAAESAKLAEANNGSIYVKDQNDDSVYSLEILVNTSSQLAIRLTEVELT